MRGTPPGGETVEVHENAAHFKRWRNIGRWRRPGLVARDIGGCRKRAVAEMIAPRGERNIYETRV